MFSKLIDMIAFVLAALAAAYRVVSFKPNGLGGIPGIAAAVAGIAIAYPAYASSDEGHTYILWGLLVVGLYVQAASFWCQEAAPQVGPSLFGRFEPAFAVAYALAARAQVGPGAGKCVLVAYACSFVHLKLLLAKDGMLERAGNLHATGTAAVSAGSKGGLVILKAAATGGTSLLWDAAKKLREKQPPVVVQELADGRQVIAVSQGQGLASKLVRVLLLQSFLRIVTGSGGLQLLLLPFAFVLWIAGYKVELPEAVQHPIQSVKEISRDWVLESKEELAERLEREKEEWKAKAEAGLEAGAERARKEATVVARRTIFGW